MTMLKKGMEVPAFKTINQDEVEISQNSLLGRKTVFYFYPKDNTPTCTVEACNLRDNYHRFLAEGYQIFGISPDTAQKHLKFIDKFKLPFDLLVDVDHKIAEAFGVWGEKQLYGRKYMGILRTTFVIDENLKIVEVIEKVRSKEHTSQLLG